jgi:acyl carrier protein
MKSQLKKSKILISVFNEFGIPLTGEKKSLRFFSDIHVDRFYVEGILFELESRLGILLNDEENQKISSPLDVIQMFRSKISA